MTRSENRRQLKQLQHAQERMASDYRRAEVEKLRQQRQAKFLAQRGLTLHKWDWFRLGLKAAWSFFGGPLVLLYNCWLKEPVKRDPRK